MIKLSERKDQWRRNFCKSRKRKHMQLKIFCPCFDILIRDTSKRDSPNTNKLAQWLKYFRSKELPKGIIRSFMVNLSCVLIGNKCLIIKYYIDTCFSPEPILNKKKPLLKKYFALKRLSWPKALIELSDN